MKLAKLNQKEKEPRNVRNEEHSSKLHTFFISICNSHNLVVFLGSVILGERESQSLYIED